MAIKVLGVGSSIRRNSYGTKALKFVLYMTKRYDAETRLLNLRDTKLPSFDPDGRRLRNMVHYLTNYVR